MDDYVDLDAESPPACVLAVQCCAAGRGVLSVRCYTLECASVCSCLSGGNVPYTVLSIQAPLQA